VTTGGQDDRFTEITSGLTEGDRVVIAERRPAASGTSASPFFAPPRRSGR
jgi:hypothetical protein